MELFGDELKSLRETIDFEPKSAEDFVSNLDVVDRMNEGFDRLESKLLAIENVYGIMAEIPIPVAADDRNALKALKVLLLCAVYKLFRLKTNAELHAKKK